MRGCECGGYLAKKIRQGRTGLCLYVWKPSAHRMLDSLVATRWEDYVSKYAKQRERLTSRWLHLRGSACHHLETRLGGFVELNEGRRQWPDSRFVAYRHADWKPMQPAGSATVYQAGSGPS